jgi:hypothetical protein
LRVNLFDEGNNLTDSELIGVGETYTVQPGMRHQFVATSEVDGYEVYWSTIASRTVDPHDIIRFSTNGVDVNWAARPEGSEYAYCCNCNDQFIANDMITVSVDNALRDMCKKCIAVTSVNPITPELR